MLEGSCHIAMPPWSLLFNELEASMCYTGQKSNIDWSCPRAACYPLFLACKSNASLACRCCVLQASNGHLNRWVHLSMTPLLQMMMRLPPMPHPQHPKQVGTLNKCFLNQFICYKFTLKNGENHSNLATAKLKFNLQHCTVKFPSIVTDLYSQKTLFCWIDFHTGCVNIQMYVCSLAYMS